MDHSTQFLKILFSLNFFQTFQLQRSVRGDDQHMESFINELLIYNLLMLFYEKLWARGSEPVVLPGCMLVQNLCIIILMLVGNWGWGIDGLQGTFGMLLSMSVMLYSTCGIGNQPHQSTLHCDQMVHQANSLLKQKFLLLLAPANTGGVRCNNQNQAISALNSQVNTESFVSINQVIYLCYCFFIFLFLFFCWVLEAICSKGRKSVENVDLLVDWFFCKNHEGRKYQLGFSPVFYFLGFLLLVSFIWRLDLLRCFTYCQEAIDKNWWALEVMKIDDSCKQMSAGSPTYQLFLGPPFKASTQ